MKESDLYIKRLSESSSILSVKNNADEEYNGEVVDIKDYINSSAMFNLAFSNHIYEHNLFA